MIALTALGNLAMKIDALTGKATSLGVVADPDSPIQGIAFSAKPFPTNLSVHAGMRTVAGKHECRGVGCGGGTRVRRHHAAPRSRSPSALDGDLMGRGRRPLDERAPSR